MSDFDKRTIVYTAVAMFVSLVAFVFFNTATPTRDVIGGLFASFVASVLSLSFLAMLLLPIAILVVICLGIAWLAR